MRPRTPKLLALATLAALAVAAPASSSPPAPPTVPPAADSIQPATVRGRLDDRSERTEDGSYYNIHTFEGVAGQNVLIEIVSTDFDTYLILLDPSGTKIAENDDGGNGTNAQLALTLPVTGTYQIRANSLTVGVRGDYTLTRRAATEEDIRQAASLAEAALLHQQAMQLHQQGRYVAAVPLAQGVLAILKHSLPANHPYIASGLNILAVLYEQQGRYSEAEENYQRSLAILEQSLPVNHPNIAASLGNLASLYRTQGRYGEAEENYLKSLAIEEQSLPANHPNIATSFYNLASLYQLQGRYSLSRHHSAQ